jgi:FAD binding domain-containing protein
MEGSIRSRAAGKSWTSSLRLLTERTWGRWLAASGAPRGFSRSAGCICLPGGWGCGCGPYTAAGTPLSAGRACSIPRCSPAFPAWCRSCGWPTPNWIVISPMTPPMSWPEGGDCFVFRLGEQATWRLLATRAAGADRLPPDPFGPPVPAAELQALMDEAGLDGQITDLAWSSRIRLQHRVADRFRQGRLYLTGDAAHAYSPATGQGMNAAIQDAANLGWKLAFAAARPGSGPLLDSYDHERRPVTRQVLAMTHMASAAGPPKPASWLPGSPASAPGNQKLTLLRDRPDTPPAPRAASLMWRVTRRATPLGGMMNPARRARRGCIR